MPREPFWLSVARSHVGIHEIAGSTDAPVIMNWAKDIKAPAFKGDSVPWCAVYANRLMLACGLPMAGKGYDLLRAKTFETWGVALKEPALGAVLVFSRPEGAHVGLYLGERADAYRVLGGNQSNAVTDDTWIKKERLTAIRWPDGQPLPTSGRVRLAHDGKPLSTNEA